jgi:hypothetical protein
LKLYSKRLMLSAISILSFGPLIFSFQNCSKTNFTAVEQAASVAGGEPPAVVIEETYVTGTEVRKISIAPSSDEKVTESGLLKVMLVVDNSATMKNSQANLTRNISYLLSSLKNRNAEVTIITSDYVQRTFTHANDLVDPVTKKTYAVGHKKVIVPYIASQRPVYKFSKSDNAASFDIKIDTVSNYIKNVGTNGSDQEAQLLSFAANLNYESFFKKGDAALIYFITDEDDQYTFEASSSYMHQLYNLTPTVHSYGSIKCKNCFSYQYSYLSQIREDGQTQEQTSAPIFANLTSCTDSYNKTQSNAAYKMKSPCAPAPQSGNAFTSTHLSCENYFKSSGAFSATEVTCTDIKLDQSSSIDNIYYGLYNSESSRASKTVNNQGLQAKFSDKVKMNLYQYDLFSGLKKHMDELFDKKYFIGVSTNIKGQSCSLSTGQSYDSIFGLMSSIIPKEQMLISSICDSVNFQTNLEAVSKSFEKIIKSEYIIDLEASESVVSIDLILTDKSVISLTSDQFVVSGKSLSFKNIDLNKYNIKHIEITLSKTVSTVKK